MVRSSQISVDDLYFALELIGRDIVANLWTVSIDDSGDAHKTVFIVAGCLIGDKSRWGEFNKAWRAQMKAKPKIDYFHQKEFASGTGQFLQFKDKSIWPDKTGYEAAGKKRAALLSTIAKSRLGCYATRNQFAFLRMLFDALPYHGTLHYTSAKYVITLNGKHCSADRSLGV